MTPSLKEQLADYKAGFATRASAQRVATMEQATAHLRASGIEVTALQRGQRVPDLELPNARGARVRLGDLWRQGPLVIVFYRGGWCPYCNLTLRAWQAKMGELETRGARLVAISPQAPDGSLSTEEKNGLAFEVLSDSALEAAQAFGIAFDLPPELVELYSSVGHDLPATNGNGRWTLPVPATYGVGPNGLILYAHVEADYRERAEPEDVLRALDAA